MGTRDKLWVQNDDTDVAFLPHIYEIHGSVLYMHCSDEEEEHSRKFYKGPSLQEFEVYEASQKEKGEEVTCLVPKCPVCAKPMKPHSMFFDETYSQRYYRYNTVKEGFVSNADCLIVIGTALATSFAANIVKGFLIRELPVIEVNLESSIKRGHNIQVLEKSETALPTLFNEYYRLKNQNHKQQVMQR